MRNHAHFNQFAAAIGSAVNSVDSLHGLMRSCAQIIVAHLDIERADIWVCTSPDGRYETIATASKGNSPQDDAQILHAAINIDLLTLQKKPWSIDLDDTKIATDRSKIAGARSCALFPIVMDDLPLGLVAVYAKAPLSKAVIDSCVGVLFYLAGCIARKQYEQQLIDSERRFGIFAENVDECLFVSAPQLRQHYYVSPSFEKIWGRPVTEVYANPFLWAESIVPEDRERVLEYVEKLQGYEMPEPEIEYRIVRPDGKKIWLHVKIFAAIDQKDGSYHICGSVSDVTQRKATEQRINDFYTMVSHELRTPLTSIKGVLLLLERGKGGELAPAAQQLTELGRKECDRLIRMINDMLDIKKIEAGKLQLHFQHLDAANIVSQTLTVLTPLASQRGITLEQEIAVDESFNADKDRVIQILTNLISNAVKYAPEQSKVSVRVCKSAAMIRFSVSDSGPGIAREEQGKLFKVFQQIEGDHITAKNGTGLGLAICKGIVDQHGGQIGVLSETGQGATFWFDLPVGLQPQS